MTSSSATSANLMKPVSMALPSILIAIGFVWFCYLPSQRLIQSKHVELEKRLANNGKSPKSVDSLSAKLNDVQAELAQIVQDCESIAKLQEAIIASRSYVSVTEGSSAGRVAFTLELLRRNNLVCVDSGLIASPPQKEERFVSVPSKTSSNSTSAGECRSKTKYRIRVQGRFQDIRKALLQLQLEQASVLLESIAMEAFDPLSDNRSWTLLLNL